MICAHAQQFCSAVCFSQLSFPGFLGESSTQLVAPLKRQFDTKKERRTSH
jgi:hypothetical protein